MARKPRIHIPGGYYHVMLRGNGGMEMFLNNESRCRFYLLMQEGVERFGHRIHAFCLMNNHIHIVIQVGEIPLSRIMQNLSFRYTRWFNAQQKRVGHLFQGRFKALLVDEENYLLELIRYTHLNPLRAGMVKQLSEYKWSSHSAYLGNDVLPWLESETVLARFSDRLDQARERYGAFISDGMREPHRPEFHGGASDARVIGCDDFAEKVLAHQNTEKDRCRLDDCIETVCRFYELQPGDLSKYGRMRKPSEARAVVAWLIRQYGSETLSDVARRFGRDVATMSSAVRRIEEKLLESDTVRGKLAEIETQLMKK